MAEPVLPGAIVDTKQDKRVRKGTPVKTSDELRRELERMKDAPKPSSPLQ